MSTIKLNDEHLVKALRTVISGHMTTFIDHVSEEFSIDKEKLLEIWNSLSGSDLVEKKRSSSPKKKKTSAVDLPFCEGKTVSGKKPCKNRVVDETSTRCYVHVETVAETEPLRHKSKSKPVKEEEKKVSKSVKEKVVAKEPEKKPEIVTKTVLKDFVWDVSEEPPKLKKEQTIKADKNLVLTVQASRYSPIEQTIDLETKSITGTDLIKRVFEYYNEAPVTEDLLEENEEDLFGYVKEAKAKIEGGETVTIVELMGDRTKFEGFEVEGNEILLILGVGA